jgi:hypothetical protein
LAGRWLDGPAGDAGPGPELDGPGRGLGGKSLLMSGPARKGSSGKGFCPAGCTRGGGCCARGGRGGTFCAAGGFCPAGGCGGPARKGSSGKWSCPAGCTLGGGCCARGGRGGAVRAASWGRVGVKSSSACSAISPRSWTGTPVTMLLAESANKVQKMTVRILMATILVIQEAQSELA